jgi:hypothetical protein
MRFAGSQLHLNLNALSPGDSDRFAGVAAKANPEVVDRIKATISAELPETYGFNESNY